MLVVVAQILVAAVVAACTHPGGPLLSSSAWLHLQAQEPPLGTWKGMWQFPGAHPGARPLLWGGGDIVCSSKKLSRISPSLSGIR